MIGLRVCVLRACRAEERSPHFAYFGTAVHFSRFTTPQGFRLPSSFDSFPPPVPSRTPSAKVVLSLG